MDSMPYDKLLIGWIQDTPHDGEPGQTFPDEFAKYFKFSREVFDKPSGQHLPYSYVSISDFKDDLHEFIEKGTQTDHFPCEIMALDYDLSQALSNEVSTDTQTIGTQTGLPVEDASSSSQPPKEKHKTDNTAVDFDGLLLGIFYGTLAREHPMGMVPMSYKMSELSGTSVPAFQELTQPSLGIDFNVINKNENDKTRTWRNIINYGVYHLRDRIKALYTSGEINVSPRDLLALSENNQHKILTISSRFATRKFPVQGLFIDIDDETERTRQIHDFAMQLLLLDLEKGFSIKHIRSALTISNNLWKTYISACEDDIVKKRWELSALISKRGYADLQSTASQRAEDLSQTQSELLRIFKANDKHLDPISDKKTITDLLNDGNKLTTKALADVRATLEINDLAIQWDNLIADENKYTNYAKVWGQVNTQKDADTFFTKDDDTKLADLLRRFQVNGEINNGSCENDDAICIKSLTRQYLGGDKKSTQHLTCISILAKIVVFLSNMPNLNMTPEIIYHVCLPCPRKPLEYPWHKGTSVSEEHIFDRFGIKLTDILQGIFAPGEKMLLIGLIVDHLQDMTKEKAAKVLTGIRGSSWCLDMLRNNANDKTDGIALLEKIWEGVLV
jgi:hypothetical protein